MRNALKNQTINIFEMGIEQKKNQKKHYGKKATTTTAAVAVSGAATQEISLIWSFERFAVQTEYRSLVHIRLLLSEQKILNYQRPNK